STRRRLRASVPHHLKEGRKLLALGAHPAALAEFNRALAISPYLAEALYHRGCVHEAAGQVEEALQDFDQALSCDPQHALSYLHRGRIRSEKGDVDPALADFDQVMAMRPNDAECYLNRGICLARKGIISEAILDFHRVLKLTNHSDYAEPARFYLNQLGFENSTPSPLPGANGSARPPARPLSSQLARTTCSDRSGSNLNRDRLGTGANGQQSDQSLASWIAGNTVRP